MECMDRHGTGELFNQTTMQLSRMGDEYRTLRKQYVTKTSLPYALTLFLM